MNTKAFLKLLPLLLLSVLLTSCNRQPKYVIGASLAGAGDWTAKLYDEIKAACYQYPNAVLDIHIAHENSKLQEEQVDSMIKAHVNLIIISPSLFRNESNMLQRAKAANIPVIVVDRQIDSPYYTAFIGRDDEQLGRMMGNYIGQTRKGETTNILEIAGSPASSPSIDRGRGLREAIAKYPNLHIVATIGGTWNPDSITARGKEFLRTHPNLKFDYVAGQSDNCAMSMRKAIEQTGGHKGVRYIGIDGLPGPKGGLQMVKEGKMEATVINPTRGFQVVDLAMNILEGKPYKRINILNTAVVDKSNIDVVMTQNEMVHDQKEQLDRQNNLLIHFFERFKHQQIDIALNIVILILLIVSFIFFYRITVLSKQMIVKEVTLRLEHYMEMQMMQSRQNLSNKEVYNSAESHFMNVLIATIMNNIKDPHLDAVTIATSMGISTEQLTSTIKRVSNASLKQIIKITQKFVDERRVKVDLS